ncbi:MAG TPA: hemolysin family protein [Desulfomicrobiaceae bacterium]|nr:hemolysin family protein [Desulfomicrobiaceae bacterium]
MFELIMAVGLAILISAFCSVAEAVLYSVPWSFIERLRKEGARAGETLAHLRNNIDRPITAILTLNTIANTAGAAVAGAAATRVLGTENLVYFSIAFTLAILILSEVLPKTIGVMYTRTLAPFLARPLLVLVWVLRPAIVLVGTVIRGVQKNRKHQETSAEDLLATISLAHRAGGIEAREAISMQNILSLDKKTVREIMTPRTVIFSLPVGLTVGEAKQRDTHWPHSRIPVYDNDDTEDLIGLVYRRQLLEALANAQDDRQLSELMKPVRFVVDSMTLDKLLVRFLESRVHLFVVLDEYGGLSGVVSLEDVLEEILGNEIVDETDQVVDMRELARQQRQSLSKARTEGKGKCSRSSSNLPGGSSGEKDSI